MEEIILTDKAKYLFLLILENDGNLESLSSLGYNYIQITQLIKKEIQLNNITSNEGKIVMTEKGLSLKESLAKKLNYTKLESLISPQLSDVNDNFPEDSFFIPSEKELPD